MARLKIAEIIRQLELLAPSGTAEDWDNVGLLVGDPAWQTAGAVVSVDLTEETIQVAKKKGYRLIVNHHPCIFPKSRGLSRIVASGASESSKLVFQALSEGIAVAAYHTNFDQCSLEVVEKVSRGLGVRPRGRLLDKASGTLLKLVVFVPQDHLDPVRKAVCDAGAGQIGNYDFCSFGAEGEGTFRGGDSTRPFIGAPGKLERTREVRFETVLPRGLKRSVVAALLSAHPYEEVAYDLYPLEQGPVGQGVVRGLGYGFWGDLEDPRPFSELAKNVKKLFQTDRFWLTEPPPKRTQKIRRIAFAAGKGASFVEAAAAAGCDVFVTGEVGYHSALDGMRRGMAIMELGHRDSEIFFISTMEKWLAKQGLKTVGLNQPTQKIWGGKK